MTQREQTIEENLGYVKGVLNDHQHGDTVLWEHYRGVITEMMKSHAEDVCIGMLKWMESVDMLNTVIDVDTIYKMFTESEGGEE